MVSRPDRKRFSHFLTILLEKLFVNSHLFCWNVYCATAKKRITRFMIEAVIFDVDGTLVDSVDLHAEAWQRAFRKFGKHVSFGAPLVTTERTDQHSANEISKSAPLRQAPHRLHKSMLSELTSERESITEPTQQRRFKKFRIVLIKPSKYDDDGYVIRFCKGVLPSNTPHLLPGLTGPGTERCVFGHVPLDSD